MKYIFGIFSKDPHLMFIQYDHNFRYKEKAIRKTDTIRIAGGKIFYIILEIITEMAEYPFIRIDKCLEIIKLFFATDFYTFCRTRPNKAFKDRIRKRIFLVIQKTKNAELFYPIQHLLFYRRQIIYFAGYKI